MALWGTVERPATVCIGMPVYDTPEMEFTRSYRALAKPNATGVGGLHGKTYVSETLGVVVDQARNDITREALSYEDLTHLLFIDSDMVFPADALARLLRIDLPVVGGLYFNRRPPFAPQLRRVNHPDWINEIGLLGVVYEFPGEGLVDVDATGCGFLLIQKQVLVDIGEDWFTKLPGLSEDYSFCARVKQIGVPVVVDVDLRLGHIAKIVVDDYFAQNNRKSYDLRWQPRGK